MKETSDNQVDYKRLIHICQKEFQLRQQRLLETIVNAKYQLLSDGTIVLPSSVPRPIALVAHYDNDPESLGYNDNGMAVVAILGLLERLPDNVEVVFTNGEEIGFVGAETYLEMRKPQPRFCINLDVCGFGDRIYIDKMNSTCLDEIKDVVTGRMPGNDAYAFKRCGIESICLSTSEGDDFNEGIDKIIRTIHNDCFDNNLNFINFGILPKVRDKVMEIIEIVNKRNLQLDER